jgi:superoxide dismutase
MKFISTVSAAAVRPVVRCLTQSPATLVVSNAGMYEHAYHMDYGAKAASYVDAFMEAIRWDNAVTLYDRYSREA